MEEDLTAYLLRRLAQAAPESIALQMRRGSQIRAVEAFVQYVERLKEENEKADQRLKDCRASLQRAENELHDARDRINEMERETAKAEAAIELVNAFRKLNDLM